jgi:OOP family OmpA-OmpF porin
MAQEIYQHKEIKRTVYERQPISSPFWLRALSWLALVGWWGFATYWYVCHIKHHCEELTADTNVSQPDTQPEPAKLPASFVVSDGSKNIVDVKDVFKARNKQAQVFVSPALQSGAVTTLANYLKTNKDRELNVVGVYGQSETNTTQYADLGIARAEDIKTRLVALGIDGNRIKTSSEMRADYAAVKDTMYNCIAMNLAVTKAVEKDITIEPRIIYFETGKSTIDLTPELQAYIRNVKAYLQQKPDARVILTGHTDDVGAEDINQKLGLQRAEKTRTELTKISIDANRVSLDSKGETQPLKPNNTADGRKVNRRCEIIVQ